MRLARFRTYDFKSHVDLELTLSGVTVILGPNNVGKSSTIQALSTLSRLARFTPFSFSDTGPYSFSGLARNAGASSIGFEIDLTPDRSEPNLSDVKYGIRLRDGEKPAGKPEILEETLMVGTTTVLDRDTVSSSGAGASIIMELPHIESSSAIACMWRNQQGAVYNDASIKRASFSLRAIGQYRLVPPYISQPGRPSESGESPAQAPGVDPGGGGVTDLLSYLREESPEAFDAVVADCAEVIDGLEALDFRASSQDPDRVEIIAIFHDDRAAVPASQLSDGTRSLLGLLTILHSPRRFRTICLEEPEIGLTPRAIEILSSRVMEVASEDSGSQFLISTHSPFLIESLLAESQRPHRGDILSVHVMSRDEGTTRLETFEEAKTRTPELGSNVRTVDSTDIADLMRRL